MVVKKLLALADSLDKKGHKELADAVDRILQSYAADEEEAAPEEEAEEAPAEEEAASEETEEVVVEEDAAPEAAPAASGDGMVGDSWYGEKGATSPDLSAPPQGSMLDKRDPSLSGGGAPVAAAPDAEAPESSDEEAPEEGAEDAAMMAYKIEVAKKLAALADVLDQKGLMAEANFVDKACKSVMGHVE